MRGYVSAMAARPPPAPASAWAMLSLCWRALAAGIVSRGAVDVDIVVAAVALGDANGSDMLCGDGDGLERLERIKCRRKVGA